MTTRNMIRFLAPAMALFALLLSMPATAAEIPMIVEPPVLDLPSEAHAQAKTPATANSAEGSLIQAPASATDEASTDDYCAGEQGDSK